MWDEWPFQKNGQSYRAGFKARDYTISTYRHCPLKAKMFVKSTSEAWTDKSSVKTLLIQIIITTITKKNNWEAQAEAVALVVAMASEI